VIVDRGVVETLPQAAADVNHPIVGTTSGITVIRAQPDSLTEE
jgi:hypothetical protein